MFTLDEINTHKSEYVKYSKIKESLTDDSKEHIRRRKEEVEDLLGDIMEALCYYEL